MNTSGEAADQVVRMSLEVGEAALKISGTGAKHLAVMLYAVLKEKKKTKGRARLETLVKSGRPLTVFSVKESDLKQFVQEAKRYGVLYCAVRNPKGSSDGLVDVIVKEEDAPRINRIVDRFQFASVTEAAKIKTEIERTRAEKAKAGKSEKQEKKPEKVQVQQEKQGQAEPEKDYPQKSKEDQLMDELFGESVKKEGKEQNPSLAKTTKSRLSEPTSKKQEKTAEGTSKLFTPEKPEKPSVRKELREIQNARKKEAERRENRNDPVRNQGNKDRNQFAVVGIPCLNAFQLNPGFAVVHGSLQLRLFRRRFNIGSDFILVLKPVRQLGHIFVLRCQHHVSDAESGVRPGGENRQFSVRQRISFLVGQTEIQLGTFRTADPVDLLRLDPVDEIQFVQIFNQSIGIFGNGDHPLFFVLAHHFGAAALAAAVDHFFVGQSHFA